MAFIGTYLLVAASCTAPMTNPAAGRHPLHPPSPADHFPTAAEADLKTARLAN